MASAKSKVTSVTPPPRRRASRGPQLDRNELQEMSEVMKQTGENGEHLYATNGVEYGTENKAAAQCLRYRKAFVAFEMFDDIGKLQGTHYSIARDPETGEKKLDDEGNELGPWVFAVKIKDS